MKKTKKSMIQVLFRHALVIFFRTLNTRLLLLLACAFTCNVVCSQEDSASPGVSEYTQALQSDPGEEASFTQTVALYDSSEINTLYPPQKKEQEVFSDSKLKYDQRLKARPGMMERFLNWLAELLFDDLAPENVILAREIIIWTIIIAALAIIVWLLSRSELVSLIRSKPKAASFNFTDITEDLNAIDFDRKINEALAQNDYRLAIRWNYLKALFVLDKKKLIGFVPFKTNIDYSNELKGAAARQGFIRLSRIYEYVWYGQFNLNANDYQIHASDFNAFITEINV